MKQVDAEGQAIREAERAEARRAESAASERGARLIERLDALPVGEVVAVSVVSLEEQMSDPFRRGAPKQLLV